MPEFVHSPSALSLFVPSPFVLSPSASSICMEPAWVGSEQYAWNRRSVRTSDEHHRNQAHMDRIL